MLLDVIQWRWDDGQNPFESVAFYSPTHKKLTYINNVSWHTPNNTVSLEGSAGRGGLSRRALRDASAIAGGASIWRAGSGVTSFFAS